MKRLSFGLFFGSACALGVSALAPGLADAAPVRMLVSGTCPSAQLVTEELDATLPEPLPFLREKSVDVRLIDLGHLFSVSVLGIERRFRDPYRRCRERADTAALLIAMALDPPALSRDSPPDELEAQFGHREHVETEPAPSQDAPDGARVPIQAVPQVWEEEQPTRRRPRNVQLLLGANLLGTRGLGSGTQVSLGADLRVGLGTDWLQAVLGVTLLSDTTLAGVYSLRRIPSIDVGVRGAVRRGRWQLALELGTYWEQATFAGSGVFFASSGRVEWSGVGARVTMGLRISPSVWVWLHRRFALVASLPLQVDFAGPANIRLEQGAELPSSYLSGMLGVGGRIF